MPVTMRGSIFCMIEPWNRGFGNSVYHAQERTMCVSMHSRSTPTRVLVVDDEWSITEFVSEVLQEEGYAVEVAHDGANALMMAYANPPDIMLIDMAMPVMTGEEVLVELRTSGYGTLPIIIATAGSNHDHLLALGATAVLSKPFTLDQLLDMVDQYCDME